MIDEHRIKVGDEPTYKLSHNEMERIVRWMLRYHIMLLETAPYEKSSPFGKLAKKDVAHMTRTLEYFGNDLGD
jgi:hypothetical protein